jgi:hypothetical protein
MGQVNSCPPIKSLPNILCVPVLQDANGIIARQQNHADQQHDEFTQPLCDRPDRGSGATAGIG